MASAAYRFDLRGGHHHYGHDERRHTMTQVGAMDSIEHPGQNSGQLEHEGEGGDGCGSACLPGRCGNSGEKCTAAEVKSYFKMFLAQLFSHVGLCALVVGYSILGAFIFSALESQHEQAIRKERGDERLKVLNELYNITGPLRTELIQQEERIAELTKQVLQLSQNNKKCDIVRRRQHDFLATIIRKYQGDNVPLFPSDCIRYCKRHKVSGNTCDKLCLDIKFPKKSCTYWQDGEEITTTESSEHSTTSTTSSDNEVYTSRTRTARSTTTEFFQENGTTTQFYLSDDNNTSTWNSSMYFDEEANLTDATIFSNGNNTTVTLQPIRITADVNETISEGDSSTSESSTKFTAVDSSTVDYTELDTLSSVIESNLPAKTVTPYSVDMRNKNIEETTTNQNAKASNLHSTTIILNSLHDSETGKGIIRQDTTTAHVDLNGNEQLHMGGFSISPLQEETTDPNISIESEIINIGGTTEVFPKFHAEESTMISRLKRGLITYAAENQRSRESTTMSPTYPTMTEDISVVPYLKVPIESQTLINRVEDEEDIGKNIQCQEITCVVDETLTATVCFEMAKDTEEQFWKEFNAYHPLSSKQCGHVCKANIPAKPLLTQQL